MRIVKTCLTRDRLSFSPAKARNDFKMLSKLSLCDRPGASSCVQKDGIPFSDAESPLFDCLSESFCSVDVREGSIKGGTVSAREVDDSGNSAAISRFIAIAPHRTKACLASTT